MKMSYCKLIKFGSTAVTDLPVYDNDPLTYCIGTNASQRFNHGSNAAIYGQNSNACQVLLAQKCADKWDDVCEYASSFPANSEYATRADTMGAGSWDVVGLTPGEILVRNTAQEKYRCAMHYCEKKTEAFAPTNPSSPLISYYVGNNCVPEYEVDAKLIDGDCVMNKILDNPKIAIQLLKNIKNTMIRKGTFKTLTGTRLGRFYGLGITRQATGPLGCKEPFTMSIPQMIATPKQQQEMAVSVSKSNGLPTSPYVVPTVSGLVPSEYVDWWPTEYIDFWPNEYDGAWKGRFATPYKRAPKYI